MTRKKEPPTPIGPHVPNPVGRPKKPARQWRPLFLEMLSATGNVSLACQAAGISRNTAYKARQSNQAFADGWGEALTTALDLLEAEARRRAMTTSDTLLIFLLKAHKPEMYRARYEPPREDTIEGAWVEYTVEIDTTRTLKSAGG